MLADPSKHHLKSMLEAGIAKLTSQYNDHRFTKTAILAIGAVFLLSSIQSFIQS